MIVQCDKCRTKFRIADERVSPKGVKVRCSRCAHVFLVRREDEAVETEVQPRAFTAQGPDTARLKPRDLLNLAAQTHPAVPDPPNAPLQWGASPDPAALALGFAGRSETRSEAITVQSRLNTVRDDPGLDAPTAPHSAPDLEALDDALPPIDSPAPSEGMTWRLPPFPGPGAGLPNSSPTQRKVPRSGPTSGRDNPFSDRFPPPEPPPEEHDPAPQWASTPTLGGEDVDAAEGAFPEGGFPGFGADGFPGGNSGDLPGLLPREAVEGDDPFAVHDDNGPDYPSPAAPLNALTPAPGARLARIDLGQVALPNFAEADGFEATAIAAAYEDQEPRPSILKRELPQVGDRGGLWPSLVGLVLGLGLVTVLLPDVGARLLDRVSTTGADAFSLVSQQRYLPESLQTLRALNTTVSGYRLGSGQLVLVVRGNARNVGAEPVQGLSAVALAMDGDTVTARAMAPVGVILEPDALFALAGPGDVDGAYVRRSAGLEDVVIPPGGERPFMVVFPEVPPAAEERTFQVEFVPVEP
ncbi:MAG: zinc-ribbon domain-containing protein [Myxococcales bacterium]|nr:zinc-ribbon domain-containing protein [Myxococcales bacterium]